MAEEKPQKRGPKKHGDYSKFYQEKKETIRPPKPIKEERKKKVVPEKKVKELPTPAAILFDQEGNTRLNKFIAHAGVCSRREADTLIAKGEVKVNGVVITELGYKVTAKDKVSLNEKFLQAERLQYVLLNKPRGFITTTDDPQDRKTVMMLVEKACNERIYPVGRLDRETSGLLLFTNDGELAKRLTHPSHRVRKMYHVVLDKDVAKADLQKLVEGVELEDGKAEADAAAYVDGKGKNEIGIELHSGKNRIVRRMFEQLGYNVIRLDRVIFASLTKKDLPRGRYRLLTEKEIHFLKMV
jgi:23S rRNA pseudouridine2605 synthase